MKFNILIILSVTLIVLLLQFCTARELAVTCFGIDSLESSVCSGNGQCTELDQCLCSPGFSGLECSNQCNNFPTSNYGARKPTVVAGYLSQAITISITMDNTDFNSSTLVFHSLDTIPTADVCRNTSSTAVSASSSWVVTVGSCTTTYTLTQTLSQVYTSTENNNWQVSVTDGNKILSSLPLFAIYSIHSGDECYTVSFPYIIEFSTSLQVSAMSDTFTTIDQEATFRLERIYISNIDGFVVQGLLSSTFQLQSIDFSRVEPLTQFVVQPSAICNTASCSMTFSSSLEALGRDATGTYKIVFDALEDGQVTRPALNMQLLITYTVPDTLVIDGETITTSVGLYSTNAYTTKKTNSFKTSTDTLFIENIIDASSPQVPPGYLLELVEGYVCCVSVTSTIPIYNSTSGEGGCKDPANKIEHAQLSGAGVTVIPATSENPKVYRIESALTSIFQSSDHSSALTCEVLLISRLSNGRRALPKNMNEEYFSRVDFSFQTAQIGVSSSSILTFSFTSILIACTMVLIF